MPDDLAVGQWSDTLQRMWRPRATATGQPLVGLDDRGDPNPSRGTDSSISMRSQMTLGKPANWEITHDKTGVELAGSSREDPRIVEQAGGHLVHRDCLGLPGWTVESDPIENSRRAPGRIAP